MPGQTTFLPDPSRVSDSVFRLTRRPAYTPSTESDTDKIARLQEQVGQLARALEAQIQYNNELRLSLDDALRSAHQRINQRAGVGALAERPASPQDGTFWLSTDEDPPILYIAAGGVWYENTTDTPLGS